MKRIIFFLIACLALLVFATCSTKSQPADVEMNQSSTEPVIEVDSESSEQEDTSFYSLSQVAEEEEPPRAKLPTPQEYIRQVVQDTVEQITEPGMSEYDKVKAATDYLIEIGDYQWPILLDIWRIRSDDSSNPSYVEIRACNFLLTGVGACEDYAAALVMLCEGMGMEARYLPGYTWGANGGLIYHAWTQVKVDGVWYHVDAELIDGISSGTVQYRYFLKGDATMSASHYWGQSLMNLDGMQPDQIEEIWTNYMGEICPQDALTPPSTYIAATPRKNPDNYVAAVLPELEEYEALYGPLEFREFEVNPPVFGEYGGRLGNTEPSDRILRSSVDHNLVKWEFE